jgi:dipeptidyl aminopeptidase/acylaminoacyl peptidase
MRHSRIGLLPILIAIAAGPANGQTSYKQPPREVVAILDAPPPPRVQVSPTRDAMLLIELKLYPSIEQLAQPILRIAGLRINPRIGCTQRLIEFNGLTIQPLDGSPARRIAMPENALVQSPVWSHDGRKVAFTRDTEKGVELWVADAATGAARPIPGVWINDVLSDRGPATAPMSWLGDSRHILSTLVPDSRGPAPEAPRVPVGPNIQETAGRKSQMPTFQDLLANPHDEELFQHFATSQLARIDTETGQVERIGPAALITHSEVSPDEKYLLVSTVRRPFSYRVPYSYFTRKTEVWDATGKTVATIADLPISDEIPRQGVPTGPRTIDWQPLHGARLIFTEALDGGDPRAKAPFRDKLMTLAAPFVGEPAQVRKVVHRFSGLSWLPEKGRALLTEFDRDRRWRTTTLLNLAHPETSPKVLFDLSINDDYKDPGRPVTVKRPDGTTTILQDGDAIYLIGQGDSPEGSRPFLDKMDLNTGNKSRLFHCAPRTYDLPIDFVGDARSKILISHQTRTEPPNEFTVDLATGKRTKLTDYRDPAPQLTGVKKELIHYKRADGVPLSGTLYLPADYKEGTRLPLIIWAYPLEYNDVATAGQVRSSPFMFPRLLGPSQLYFVTRGYALLDEATMPVVGDPETMNDTYIEQIGAAARAAIDAVDKKGVIDPRRVGVGGHSYGAFMTANLLAHTDLFAAGIARSGAYNRSLTPFGFQTERRSYWEATDLYTRMSPFTYAHKINEPILLIHGEADNNTGTFPIQSERLYQAIKGNGGTARLVLLPHESHAYRSRESVLHVLAEMFDWADRYVKNRPDPSGTPVPTSGATPPASPASGR